MLKEELNTKSPSFVVVYCVTLYCVSVAVCSVYTGKGRDRLQGNSVMMQVIRHGLKIFQQSTMVNNMLQPLQPLATR